MRVENLLRGPEPFEIGQEVTIRKAMGGNGNYHHGGNVKQVPLGSKAKIVEMGRDILKLELEVKPRIELNPKKKTLWQEIKEYFGYGEQQEANKNYWEVHPGEIVSRVLPQPKIESPNIVGKAPTLDVLLTGEISDLRDENEDTRFKPKLNVREEFAIWIQEQFPNYKTNRESYEKLEKRKNEVRKAAIKACEHGVDTTGSCVQGYFENHLAYFKGSDTRNFYENLSVLTKLIAEVAVNIGEHHSTRDWHYGTSVIKTGKRKQR